MKTKHSLKMKSVISAVLAIVMILGTLPAMNVFAAQKSDYVDPADNWLKTNNRTNELDMNATVTYETQWCPVCNKDTTVLTYRVPEYTKSGQTAMNHGVKWSDGYEHVIIGTSGENLVKSRGSALVPISFLLRDKPKSFKSLKIINERL